jgi:glycosyltransferase involved in cell wall biosynthesis
MYVSSKKKWGGVVSWMQKTAIGLQDRGHKVWILSHPKSAFNRNNKEKQINIISWKLGSDYNIISIIYLIYLIKKHNIQLLVGNIEKEISNAGVAAMLCAIPLIRRIGNENDFIKRPKTKFNHLKFVETSIVPSQYTVDKIRNRASWLKEIELHVIHNGRNPLSIDEQTKNDLRKKLNIPLDKKILGVTCNLVEVKYVSHLISAFSKLHNENIDAHLVIVGDGYERPNLEQQVKDLNLSKFVTFTGFSDHPQLYSSLFDVSVLPSEIEGFANTIVEYFSVGSACVVTDVGGAREIIKDGENGFLIEFGDIDALTLKIRELLVNEDLRAKFCKNSLQTLKEKFTAKIMIDKLENLYQSKIDKFNR